MKYGIGNERRLTGKHETAAISDFTWGVADRGASIRVGNETFANGAGYMEDRRPAANMDPYVVTSMLAKTTLASTTGRGRVRHRAPRPRTLRFHRHSETLI